MTTPKRPKTHSFEALDSERTIDDRWTESKLIAAGYEWSGDRACNECGDQIVFYKREKGRYGGQKDYLVLNEGALDPHRCRDRA